MIRGNMWRIYLSLKECKIIQIGQDLMSNDDMFYEPRHLRWSSK